MDYVYKRLETQEHIRLLKLPYKDADANAKDKNENNARVSNLSQASERKRLRHAASEGNMRPAAKTAPAPSPGREPSHQSRTVGKLCLGIMSFPLDNAPPYECVSYAWVTKTRTERVATTHGTFVLVTESLLEALPYLADVSETGYLWIDQLCVNQDDIDERSSQVSIMSKIYRASARLLVWLGPSNMDSYRVKELVDVIHDNKPGAPDQYNLRHHLQNDKVSISGFFTTRAQILTWSSLFIKFGMFHAGREVDSDVDAVGLAYCNAVWRIFDMPWVSVPTVCCVMLLRRCAVSQSLGATRSHSRKKLCFHVRTPTRGC